jgi:hypothetical protein
MRSALLAAVIALISSGCCWGFDKEHYAVFGDGTSSCGEYVKAADREKQNPRSGVTYKDPYYIGFMSFANGFLSGSNMMGGILGSDNDLGHQTSFEGRMLWLDNWCREHPLSMFSDATGHLVGFLKEQKH